MMMILDQSVDRRGQRNFLGRQAMLLFVLVGKACSLNKQLSYEVPLCIVSVVFSRRCLIFIDKYR